ncbi:DNA-binding NarL/FixJ family response regulator [Lutibacter sp. Hel_I_33_5]|uniref:response regulator n=1 Tax=Lutibacter sp. Hel_I_33_5 TaxID=1566289 RepID=UPI00119EBDD7|nr:response regulator transcription factor [Lutibacter sp. Hel_I_33_5]TVZ55351.1 DNA-binding NarL/FixJ family response regulator [Lutibacter sp. Hel_I_33_5]
MNGLQKVVIVEDDKVLLESYKYFFSNYTDYHLVKAFSNIEDLLIFIDTNNVDIIISDVNLPGLSGIEGLKRVKKINSDIKMILISIHEESSIVIDSIKNHADGYLIKPISEEELLKTLNLLEKGGIPLSENVTLKLVEELRFNKIKMFSERENEIASLLLNGNTYSSIAEKLFISASTVNYHIQKIYLKLNVNSKIEALKILRKLK